MGVSLAERRAACSVAGAVAARGGACQSRIHSGGAIDLDSFPPGGQGGGGGGGIAGKLIRCRGRGRREMERRRDRELEMFWSDGFIISAEANLQIHRAESVGVIMHLVNQKWHHFTAV